MSPPRLLVASDLPSFGLPESFRIEIRPDRGGVDVIPVGELDLATVPELEQQLVHLRDGYSGRMRLDLRRLTFMDCSGLHLCLKWCRDSTPEASNVILVQGPIARRLFEAAISDQPEDVTVGSRPARSTGR